MLKKEIDKIKRSQAPVTLNLCDCNIGVTGAKLLADTIKEAKAPFNLNLWSNNIGDEGAGFLADAIRHTEVPLILDLGSNAIGAAGAKLLADAIKTVKFPVSLNLGFNNIGDIGARFIADTIKLVQSSLYLNLWFNNIGLHGVILLADAIKKAQAPLILNLGANNIGVEGVEWIADSIKQAQVLLTLSLGGNNIRGAEAKFFAEAIKEARVPLTLEFPYNMIGDVGAEFLAEGIKEARVPTTLNLLGNKIGDVGAKFFAEAIKEARVPITLKFSYNVIEDAGAKSLAKGLKKARVPITLNLSGNKIGDDGAKFLAEATEDNFITDARGNPLGFLRRIKFSPSMRVLEQESGFPSVLVNLVQGYIGDEDLAWAEVAAIRAVEGASHENKYSSINYELLNAAYFPKVDVEVASGSLPEVERMADDDRETRGASSSSYSLLQSQVLNLLLLLSRIKALSNRLEVPQGYVDVPGDGLCFYHAISRQLGSNGYTAIELQQMSINEIINHLDRYEGFAAQYGGGLDGFLNYHLQRQESEKGGWADNIMIQALANALERVIEIQLFSRAGNAIGAGPVVINPHQVSNPDALRLGNIEDLHFVAATVNDVEEEVSSSSADAMADDGPEEKQAPVRPLKRKQAFAKDAEANKAAKLEAERTIQGDEVHTTEEDKIAEEEIDWDQYRCEVQKDSYTPTPASTPAVIFESGPTPSSTSQIYYEALEFGDASPLMFSGMDSVLSNSN
jgi:Ran GTPase-activating protein (RanGAP) involved in mRNA processing and transport